MKHDLFEGLGDRRHDISGSNSRILNVLHGYCNRVFSVKGLSARQHLVEHNANGIDIRTLVGVFAPRLLGRNVMYGADGLIGDGLAVNTREPCNTEIHDLYCTVREKQDVLGLDVAVNNALVVSVLQCFKYLHHKLESILPPQNPLLFKQLLQRDTVNVLHNDELYLIGEAHIVDLYDIGMGEDSNSLAFVAEASYKLIVL